MKLYASIAKNGMVQDGWEPCSSTFEGGNGNGLHSYPHNL